MLLNNEDARRAFRWPVSAAVDIAAPAARVWQVISSPDSLIASHPFLADNPIENWPGPVGRDEVHYLNGVVYTRDFKEWHDGAGFELEISKQSKKIAWVSWQVTPVAENTATLRITVFPYAMQDLSPLIRWVPYLFILRPRLRSYLRSVVGGFQWFIEKGAAVPRNQFGAHPWFSGD